MLKHQLDAWAVPKATARDRSDVKMTEQYQHLREAVLNWGQQLRGRTFSFRPPTTDEMQVPPAFLYQDQIVGDLIDHWLPRTERPNGIICLPTGAGKTRIAIELIARTLAVRPNHRFVWASGQKNLLIQSIQRLVDLAPLFLQETSFLWANPPSSGWTLKTFEPSVTFMTRDSLQHLGARVEKKQIPHHLHKADGITIIYDECHELGGKQIYKAMSNMLACLRAQDIDAALVGLSATPIPTSPEGAHHVRKLFPRDANGSYKHELGVHTFAFVERAALVKQRVLCPVNNWMNKNRAADFDIRDLVAQDPKWTPCGSTPKERLNEIAKYYNREVMSHPVVIDKLARGFVLNSEHLGKTLIFTPTISAANEWARAITRAAKEMGYQDLLSATAVLHSRLGEFQETDDAEDSGFGGVSFDDSITTTRIVNEFRNRGDGSCALVNVNMATTGFDDPRVQTIILGRLTFSSNLFWQMIGRGTRGPACNGTLYCNVIESVPLLHGFGFTNLSEYQPTLVRRAVTQVEGDISEDQSVPVLGIDPRKASVQWADVEDSPEYRALKREMQAILRAFVNGPLDAAGALPEIEAVKRAAPELFPQTVSAKIRSAREEAREAIGTTLDFLPSPPTTEPMGVAVFLQQVKMCIEKDIKTLESWNQCLHQLMMTVK
jgi:superfamily II DNA or RNA helicase